MGAGLSKQKKSKVNLPSYLQELPRELCSKLIDYAPELVPHLRLTSRIIKSHVDDYVSRRNLSIPLIDELRMDFSDWNGAKECLELAIVIPIHKMKLLRLRIKDCESLIVAIKSNKRRKNAGNEMGRCVYYFHVAVHDYNLIDNLRWCIGKQSIRRVAMRLVSDKNKYNENILTTVSKVFEAVHFRQLTVYSTVLPDGSVNRLLQTVSEHKIDHVTLYVKDVTAEDPVKFLLDLSDLVSSISIYQHWIHDREEHIFFGLRHLDWAPIILTMFSRKLNKMAIENRFSRKYLSDSCANVLIKQLPSLGKKILFSATCNGIHKINYIQNDHLVKVVYDEEMCILSVKHREREKEEFNDEK